MYTLVVYMHVSSSRIWIGPVEHSINHLLSSKGCKTICNGVLEDVGWMRCEERTWVAVMPTSTLHHVLQITYSHWYVFWKRKTSFRYSIPTQRYVGQKNVTSDTISHFNCGIFIQQCHIVLKCTSWPHRLVGLYLFLYICMYVCI